MPAAVLPLTGLLAVEIGTSVAGPFAGQILADLGAEVVKIENPQGGDDARNWGPPFVRGAAPIFNAVNRNKRSAAVDLKDEAAARGAAPLHPRRGRYRAAEPAARPGRELRPRRRDVARGAAVADLLQSRRLRRRRPAQGSARLRPADAGVRRPHEPHRRGRPRARAHRPLDHRPGQRHVGGDRDPVGAAIGAPPPGRAAWSAPRSTRPRSAGPTCTSPSYLASGRVPRRMGSENFGICPYKAYQARDGWVVIAAGNDNLFRAARRRARPSRNGRRDPRFKTNPDRVTHRDELNPLVGDGDRDRYGRRLGREVAAPPACPARRCSISSR